MGIECQKYEIVVYCILPTILLSYPPTAITVQESKMKTNPAKEVQLLSDIAKGLAESLDLQQTLRSILQSLDTYLKLQRGTITLLNPDTETINIEIAHGLSENSKKKGIYRMGEGITGTVVQTGKEIIVPDISKDPRFVHKTGAGTQQKAGR